MPYDCLMAGTLLVQQMVLDTRSGRLWPAPPAANTMEAGQAEAARTRPSFQE